MTPFFKSVAQDVIIFGTLIALVGAVANPLINITLIEPQQRLERRMEKLETAHEQTRDRLGNIDKSLAVLAEATKQTADTLHAIREFLSAKERPRR